jgi:hypothetical protein
VHKVNKALHDHLLDYVPIWIKKSNFMGLLNLRDMMRARGAIRLHWELGGRGKRVIQDFKKNVGSMQGRWAYLAHLKVLQLKSLNRILLRL